MSQPMPCSLVALVHVSMPSATVLRSKRLAELDDGLAQAGIDVVDVAIGDVAAIDLQLAERQLPQPRQRRIAGAEIVERQSAIQRAQLIGDVIGDLEIAAAISSSVTSRMRPGQFGVGGRSSRSIARSAA